MYAILFLTKVKTGIAMKKIPVTVITGFLGSGKTTLINKIIKQNSNNIKIGILLNEFGDVALESQFLVKTDEEVVELPNGCVCCVARGELLNGLEKIINAKPNTEYIILEASGLSDPLALLLTFYNPIFISKFRLDTIVGVVDYLNFEKVLDIYDIARHQIHFSNIVLITKSKPGDNLDQIKELLSDINPKAIIFQDSDTFNTMSLLDQDLLDLTDVDQIKTQMKYSKHDEDSHNDHEPHIHEEVDHVFFQTDRPISFKKLEEYLENNLPNNVIRAKGFVYFADAPIKDSKYLLQYVAGRKDWFRTGWDRKKSTGILLVGKKLNTKSILKDLENCITK